MSDFKIGDKVLCVEGHTSNSSGHHLILGEIYTIHAIAVCICGNLSIDVGIVVGVNARTACRTCKSTSEKGKWYLRPSRFIKMDGKLESIDVSEFMGVFTKKTEEV